MKLRWLTPGLANSCTHTPAKLFSLYDQESLKKGTKDIELSDFRVVRAKRIK